MLKLLILILISLPVFGATMPEEQASNFHFQMTAVTQDHDRFDSPYQGKNSLQPIAESATSLTWSIFAGQRLWRGGEIYVDPELVGGSGFSHTLGIAGFPNGEIYRVDDASAKWNLSRLYFNQTIELGDEKEQVPDEKNQLATRVAVRRFTFLIGKFALNDFFDNNIYSHDPRTQFLNWTFMDNGAWDYAADTRGYSWGLYLLLNQPGWALRFASTLVPLYANQMQMDYNFPAHRGDNLEFEYRYEWMELKGAVRLLAYENIANMGNYRQTLDTQPSNPDVTLTRDRRTKYGFGLNAEQELTNDLGAFFRAGWNDGHTETWAFTEIDRMISMGFSLKGLRWFRPDDTVGVGFTVNLLSSDHRDYLAAGGMDS